MSNEETEAEPKEEEHHHEDSPITHDPSVRAKWLSTLVALPIALHYPALIIAAAMGAVDIEVVTQAWFLFDTLGWLTVMTYIFGEKTVDAARKALGKDV